MENTVNFKFYPHDFNIFGFIDIVNYIGGFVDIGDYIGGFIDIGDEALYIDESLQSAPLWSCGCRRQSDSVFSCSRRRKSGSVFSCSRRQEARARSIFEFHECVATAHEGQGKDVRVVWKYVHICWP